MAEAVGEWKEGGVEGLVWDGAKSHGAEWGRAVGVKLVRLPPYAPELNPAEGVFEEVRRDVESRVYGTLEKRRRSWNECCRRS